MLSCMSNYAGSQNHKTIEEIKIKQLYRYIVYLIFAMYTMAFKIVRKQ